MQCAHSADEIRRLSDVSPMSTVETLVVGPVATVTLNRPEVRNAFDAHMIAELTEVFTSLAVSPTVRVIVLRGAGRVFSGGADVNWMRNSLDFTEDQNVEDARNMSSMFSAIDTVDKLVIGKV